MADICLSSERTAPPTADRSGEARIDTALTDTRRRSGRPNHFSRDGSLRPPWSTELSVRDACTSCGDCIRACPEAVLRTGPADTPVVDFAAGACTFCKACAEVCPEPVFDLTTPPWALTAEIQPACLLNTGVSCRSCTDACDDSALRFDLTAGSVGHVVVDDANCTGCGACLSMCPVGAIALAAPKSNLEDAR